MQFPIVREYKTDIQGTNPDNLILNEPKHVEAGVNTRIVVPRHAPFFINSELKLTFPNGEPMYYDVHYRVFQVMNRLTELTGQGIGCMIELLDDNITDFLWSYRTVGHFSLIDKTMLNLLTTAVNDNRPVYWEYLINKPVVFDPKLHGHSLLRDIMAFQDLIECLDLFLTFVTRRGGDNMSHLIQHYTDLVTNYINVFSQELSTFLNNHKNAVNAHGFTALQAGLEKVDNFETANSGNILQERKDLAVTPDGLRTIVDTYGFNSDEFISSGVLPLSRFGNTNFIPPNIDGSFEGLGGDSEAAAITMEPDGSIVFLWNRLDGRINGLYYSVLTGQGNNTVLTYTGFKYEHPLFATDGASVNRIVQGSGGEVILVGDTSKSLYYLGLTNGSLDPSKHVYSRINLRPLIAKLYTAPGSVNTSIIFPWVNVVLMGDWIYIFHSVPTPTPVAPGSIDISSNLAYKNVYRVALADVQAKIDVTAVAVNLNFTDADGVQVSNSPFYRWYSTTKDASGNVTRGLANFNPPAARFYGVYRSVQTVVAPDPNRPGVFALKFTGGYYADLYGTGKAGTFSYTVEINYDFDTATNTMTLTSQTNMPPVTLDQVPSYPPSYIQNNDYWLMTFQYLSQSLTVLDNGQAVVSATTGFSGFPRQAYVYDIKNSNSRYASVSRLWGLGTDLKLYVADEKIVSPMESSINVKSVAFQQGGEYYLAGSKTNLNMLQLFWKSVSGKFAVRPAVTNLFYANIQSRPLSSSVRRVNAPVGMGLACVSVPSANLDSYTTEAGESSFCVNAQTRYFDRANSDPYGAWVSKFTTSAQPDEVLLISRVNQQVESDGTMTLVPVTEILYTAAITEMLKNEVQYPNIKNTARFCAVTISDPTNSNLSVKFGWLPVVVGITYAAPLPANDLYSTFLTIEPVYSVSGNRSTVTGYTVTNKVHYTNLASAVANDLRVYGASGYQETTISTHGAMRSYYYLEGNKVSVYFTPAIMGQTTADAFTSDLFFTINDRTASRVWASSQNYTRFTGSGGPCMTPDNGIGFGLPWQTSTGGAGTLQNGRSYIALIGSLYPEVGWMIFFKSQIDAVFNGKLYTIPAGTIDLRDIDAAPQNKTFYVYAVLVQGVPKYQVTLEKRLDSANQLWVAKVTTNAQQILTIERYNVFAMNGKRVSETKQGNTIPAASGLVSEEGQLPWLTASEFLP